MKRILDVANLQCIRRNRPKMNYDIYRTGRGQFTRPPDYEFFGGLIKIAILKGERI